jgi:hypothetical protein
MQTLNLGKAIRRVTLIKSNDSNLAMPLVVHRRKRKRKKQSKILRPIEKLTRRLADAELAAVKTYADGHRRANRRKKNGWARKLTTNLRRARKKFWRKLR